MVASSILPVTIYKNKLYFLFGKENPLEDSSKGYSDFGGGVEKGESIFETALREGSEELTGFLGNKQTLKHLINKNGGVYKLSHNDYNVNIFYLEYDENLPKYYNENHKFLWNRMDKKELNDTKLFEKIEINWFSIIDIINKKNEFRNFYKEITNKIIIDENNIKKFIKKQLKNKKITKKNKMKKNKTKKNDKKCKIL